MFGYHRNKREKKRLKKERQAFEDERRRYDAERSTPEAIKQQADERKENISQQVQESKQNRQEARKEGQAYAEDFMKREVQGLTPAQQKAIQYEASQKINRDMQAANRRLLGEQGRRNIGKNSGVAFAQGQELQRAGQEAYGQSQRDLTRLNEDQRNRNRAAMFNIEQGEAAQAQLDRQMAIDELELSAEKRRQRALEDQLNRIFSRI